MSLTKVSKQVVIRFIFVATLVRIEFGDVPLKDPIWN